MCWVCTCVVWVVCQATGQKRFLEISHKLVVGVLRVVATYWVSLCEGQLVWKTEINVLKSAVTIGISRSHKLTHSDPGLLSGSRGWSCARICGSSPLGLGPVGWECGGGVSTFFPPCFLWLELGGFVVPF